MYLCSAWAALPSLSRYRVEDLGARAIAVAREVGGVALAIDAKDGRAAEWYERFGALRLLDDPLKLVLPLDTIRSALEQS